MSILPFSFVNFILFFNFYYYYYFFTLQYCIGFVIHQRASATGIHVFPILNPPPTSLPIPSLWVIPVHQPQASCILHQTWTGDSFLIWYYTCFNAILPNYPPPHPHTQQKRHRCIEQSFALQCSWLENPREEGAGWAAVSGVAQSRRRLKWLSSSSSRLSIKKKKTHNVRVAS